MYHAHKARGKAQWLETPDPQYRNFGKYATANASVSRFKPT